MAEKSLRKISLHILYDVYFNEKLLNIAINENVETLSDEDKAFVKRECTGVIEKNEELDKVITKYSKSKLNKLNRDVLIILKIGVYEILFMDKVPAYATVNECVNVIKKSKSSKYANFVNAILRNVLRNETVEKENNDMEKNCYFRIYNNHEESVLKELEGKSISFKKYDGALSFNYAKVYSVSKYKDVLDLKSFKEGDILIMDASSIFLTDKLAYYIKEREKEIKLKTDNEIVSMMKLLDTCASPGGKILSLIDLIYDDYFYFYAEARDISKEKIFKICENVNRLKVLDLNMLVKDAQVHDSLDDDKYDVVICDVPCTGTGVISKKPDIKLRLDKDKLDSLVSIQKQILDSCKHYVKKGGILSYSTCTETREENEDNINDFLSKNSDYEKLYEKRIMSGDENKADGFYMCFLKRV